MTGVTHLVISFHAQEPPGRLLHVAQNTIIVTVLGQAFISVSTGWSVNTATTELCNSCKQRPRTVSLRRSASYNSWLITTSGDARVVKVIVPEIGARGFRFPLCVFSHTVFSLAVPCAFPLVVIHRLRQ